jgi:hypothetical protein
MGKQAAGKCEKDNYVFPFDSDFGTPDKKAT